MWETCFTFPFHNSTGDLWLLFLGWLTGGPGIKPVTGSEVRLTVCVIAVKDNVHYYLIVWFFVVFFFLFFFLNIFTDQYMCLQKQTNKQTKHVNQVKTTKMAVLLCLCWSLTFCSHEAVCVETWTDIIWLQNVIVYISVWIWACHRYYEYFTPFTVRVHLPV